MSLRKIQMPIFLIRLPRIRAPREASQVNIVSQPGLKNTEIRTFLVSGSKEMSVAEILYILSGREKGLRTFLCPLPKMVWAPPYPRGQQKQAGRLRRHWHRRGSQHAEGSTDTGGSCATSGRQGRGLRAARGHKGLWLTDGPEHMVRALAGTSRLAGEKNPAGSHSFT